MSGAEAVLIAGLVLGNGADLASTEIGLRQCPACVEANPLIQSQPVRIVVKAAVTGAEIWAVRKLWKKHKPLAVLTAVGLVAANGYATQHNLRQGGER